jgi:ribonuclease HII
MQRAVCELKTSTGLILVDGQFKIPGLEHCQQECLVQGELRAHPIAAASIVAKVARDQLMKELAKDYPGYGFESHKGYGTKAHKKAIVELGVTNHHRKTFVGVTEWVGPRSPA